MWTELRPYLHALIEDGQIVRVCIPAKDAADTTLGDAAIVMQLAGVLAVRGSEWQQTSEGDLTLEVLPINSIEHFSKKGGSAKTAAKKASSAENGKKGGRPKSWKRLTMDSGEVVAIVNAEMDEQAAEAFFLKHPEIVKIEMLSGYYERPSCL